jgi:hypothetical protein
MFSWGTPRKRMRSSVGITKRACGIWHVKWSRETQTAPITKEGKLSIQHPSIWFPNESWPILRQCFGR